MSRTNLQFNNLRLRTKLLISFSVIIVLLSFFITLSNNWFGERNTIAEKAKSYMLVGKQILINFSFLSDNIENELFNKYTNSKIADYIIDADNSSKRINIESNLLSICFSSSYIKSAVVTDEDDNSYTASREDEAIELNELMGLIENRSEHFQEPTVWMRGRDNEIYVKKELFIVFPLKRVGEIFAVLQADALEQVIGIDYDVVGSVGIFDNDMNPVLLHGVLTEEVVEALDTQYGMRNRDELSFFFNYDKEKFYVTFCTSDDYDWKYISMIPSESMLSIWKSVKRFGFLSALLVSIGALIIAIFISKSFMINIQKLNNVMNKVSSGELSVEIDIHSKDEIGDLAAQFNSMLEKLRQALSRIVEETEQKHRVEYEFLETKYRSLQSQLSPHFFCNILSSIDAFSCLGENDNASKLSIEAGNFIRTRLRHHDIKFIGLKDEIEGFKNYFNIFQSIYGGDIELSILCDEESIQYLVPNMILLPVVENALIHGFSPELKRAFLLEVRVSRNESERRLKIEVEDNGIGINKDKMNELNSFIKSSVFDESTEKNLGTRIVLQRLKLLYPDNFQFEITSVEGVKTLVVIEVPLLDEL